MMHKIIGKGAEAVLIKKNNILIKDRIKKSYRISYLDLKLRKTRTKKEAKILLKASKLIPVPTLIKTDEKEKIEMQFILGKKLSESLDKLKNSLKIEDKAVDLHLIKQALEAKLFKNYEKFFKTILKGYEISKIHKEVLKRLEKV